MAEHHRICPVADMEALPSRPLVPQGTLRSEKGNPVPRQPSLRPTIPVQAPLKPPKQRSCCCRCICWTIGFLILLLVIIGAIAGILYLVFNPKLPNYSVDNLRISDLRLNIDLSLYARFNVKITVPWCAAKVLPRPPE